MYKLHGSQLPSASKLRTSVKNNDLLARECYDQIIAASVIAFINKIIEMFVFFAE